MRELSPAEHDAMIDRLWDRVCGGDPTERFDFAAMADDLQRDVASGAVCDPNKYDPPDPAFWAAMAKEARAIAVDNPDGIGPLDDLIENWPKELPPPAHFHP